jgi:hypothetical protein
MDKGNPEFEPIQKDEKINKIYFCIGCGSVATQTALFKIEGAVILERYCDVCASKLNQR